MDKNEIEITIVVPIYNSEKIIPEFVQRVNEVMSKHQINFELIMINDYSTDNSEAILQKHAEKFSNILTLSNEQNQGQIYTTNKGISLSKGKYIVTIDDDLEYQPFDIINLYNYITSSSYQVVFGIAPNKYKLQGKSNTIAKLRNRLLNFLWRKPITDSFKIFKRDIVFNNDEFLLKNHFEGFITKNLKNIKIGYLDVSYSARFDGQTNYTFFKKLKLFFHMNKGF